MDDAILTKKIQALLHDPPEKPIILGRIGHEGRAREIMSKLIEEAEIPKEVREADHIASAADRVNFPTNEKLVADFLKAPRIVHPLSGKEFDLESLAQLDAASITDAVDRAIVDLAEKYGEDKEKIYLGLWKELLGRLQEGNEGDSKLGQLWGLLPADTRVPDHSIWEHKRVTAAIAGALPKPAFLLFAIGPVQEFIATARKTQDLWAGSYLLSYLAWKAMETVVHEYGPDSIIFPDLCGQPLADLWLIDRGIQMEKPGREELSSPTLPNRFFAVLPQAAAEKAAQDAEKAARNAFVEVCNSVKQLVETETGVKNPSWDALWTRQTSDFLETYWAVSKGGNPESFLKQYKELLGLSGDWEFGGLFKEYQRKGFDPNIGTVYGQVYRLTEKALGSRKLLRDFAQAGEPNHKCTLCGVREPVHPGTYNGQNCTENFGALRAFWQDVVLRKFPDIRESERLCSICLTKRFGAKAYFKQTRRFDIENSFPSLSMVATAQFKLRVIENLGNVPLSVAVGSFVEAVRHLEGEDRWNGVPLPMVRRSCSARQSISSDFAALEGDWLYDEAFDDTSTLWKQTEGRLTRDQFDELLQNARRARAKLIEAIGRLEEEQGVRIGTPSLYYAILLMDGDNMGKWLSGDYAPLIREVLHPAVRNSLDGAWKHLLEQKRPLSPSLHLAMSKALRDFSLRVVREIVEKDHLGKLVYAGGDDVLAFVALKDLLPVMRKLRASFSGSLTVDAASERVIIDFNSGSGFVPLDKDGLPINPESSGKRVEGFALSMGTSATASMGIVIAHHSSNLTQVLEEVRRREKQAKENRDKNAFSIALAKRAGGTEYLTVPWYFGEDRFETVRLLQHWADAFHRDELSPKLAYTLRTESAGLKGLPTEAIRAELVRIADRQRNKAAENFGKKDLVPLVDGLIRLAQHGADMDALSVFLSVAVFLGREGNR